MGFGGGGEGQKNFWGDAYAAETTRPHAFGMPQQSVEYFAPNPMLSSFGMNFALKFGGEDQENKSSLSQNLRLLDHVHSICLAVS